MLGPHSPNEAPEKLKCRLSIALGFESMSLDMLGFTVCGMGTATEFCDSYLPIVWKLCVRGEPAFSPEERQRFLLTARAIRVATARLETGTKKVNVVRMGKGTEAHYDVVYQALIICIADTAEEPTPQPAPRGCAAALPQPAAVPVPVPGVGVAGGVPAALLPGTPPVASTQPPPLPPSPPQYVAPPHLLPPHLQPFAAHPHVAAAVVPGGGGGGGGGTPPTSAAVQIPQPQQQQQPSSVGMPFVVVPAGYQVFSVAPQQQQHQQQPPPQHHPHLHHSQQQQQQQHTPPHHHVAPPLSLSFPPQQAPPQIPPHPLVMAAQWKGSSTAYQAPGPYHPQPPAMQQYMQAMQQQQQQQQQTPPQQPQQHHQYYSIATTSSGLPGSVHHGAPSLSEQHYFPPMLPMASPLTALPAAAPGHPTPPNMAL